MARGDAAFMSIVRQAMTLADDFSRRLGTRIRGLVAAFSPLNAATRSRLMQQIDAILNAAFGLTQRTALLSELYLTILTATDAAAARPFSALFSRIETALNRRSKGLWDRIRAGLLSAPADDPLARAYNATTSFNASRTAFLRAGKLDPNRRWVKGDGTSYRLSDRVWKQGRRIRKQIDRILRDSIRNGLSPDEIGTSLERYIAPGATPSASSMARTLARTETTRIYHEAEKLAAAIAPDVVGLRWKLGQGHSLYDYCEFLAEQDAHGLGPGGYPPRDVPDVPHPNCLCLRDLIFATDVDLATVMLHRYGTV